MRAAGNPGIAYLLSSGPDQRVTRATQPNSAGEPRWFNVAPWPELPPAPISQLLSSHSVISGFAAKTTFLNRASVIVAKTDPRNDGTLRGARTLQLRRFGPSQLLRPRWCYW